MSTFSKGDKVRVIDVEGQDPLRTVVLGLGEIHTVDDVTRHGWPRFGGYDWLPERFEKVEPEHAEPEDKDDLYVEPEPLKEGAWVQVWAQVERVHADGDLMVRARSSVGTEERFYVHPDAIVRPVAGQVPPWVKPAQCTSLWEASPNDYARCIKDEHDDTEQHNRPGVFWTDAEAYGRVVESGGAS